MTLDGSGSTDADGAIASYSWTENSVEIAKRLSLDLELGKSVLPAFPTPDGEDEAAMRQAVAETPGAIGYLSREMIDETVNELPLQR